MLRALNLLALEVAAVLQSEAGAEEIAADELLPLFVFVLVRARVPSLYSQARFVSDFLPKHYALGRHGYSLATLQAALQYLLDTSWAAVRSAAARERQLRDETRRRSHREHVARQVASERLVELCDCPYGSEHGLVMQDANGRLLRRGDHIVRGTKQRAHHGIFYGGSSGSDVIHYARKHAERDRRHAARPGACGCGNAAMHARGDGTMSGELAAVSTTPTFGRGARATSGERRGGARVPSERQVRLMRSEHGHARRPIVLERMHAHNQAPHRTRWRVR